MNDGYGSNRYSQRGGTRNNFNRSTWESNERNADDSRGPNTFDKENGQAASGGQQRMSRGVKEERNAVIVPTPSRDPAQTDKSISF